MFTRTQQQQQQQQQRRRCARPSMQLHVMVGDVSVTLCYFQGTSRVTCEITVSSCAARFEMVTPTDCRLLRVYARDSVRIRGGREGFAGSAVNFLGFGWNVGHRVCVSPVGQFFAVGGGSRTRLRLYGDAAEKWCCNPATPNPKSQTPIPNPKPQALVT